MHAEIDLLINLKCLEFQWKLQQNVACTLNFYQQIFSWLGENIIGNFGFHIFKDAEYLLQNNG